MSTTFEAEGLFLGPQQLEVLKVLAIEQNEQGKDQGNSR